MSLLWLSLLGCHPPIVLNEAPVIEVLSPADPGIVSELHGLALSVRASDADSRGDLVLTVVSDLDGHLGDFTLDQGVATDLSIPGASVGDHVLSLSVDDGGLRGLTREELSIQVNGAPAEATITSEPAQPVEGMPWSVQIVAGEDPEADDAFLSDITWRLDGEIVDQGGGRFSSETQTPGFHLGGTTLELEVTTRDSDGDGRADDGNAVVRVVTFDVLRHPIAEASSVTMTPAVPHPWSTMHCAVDGLEGVTYHLDWTVDGESARQVDLEGPLVEDVVARQDLPEGDLVACEVRASSEAVSRVTVDERATTADGSSPGSFSQDLPYVTDLPSVARWATDDGFDLLWVDGNTGKLLQRPVDGLLSMNPGTVAPHYEPDTELDVPDLATDHVPVALRGGEDGERLYLISTGPEDAVQIHVAEEAVDTGTAPSWSLLSDHALSAPLLGAQTYRPDPFSEVALALWLGDDDASCVRTLVGDTTSLTTTTICQSIAPWAGPPGDFARADLDHDDTTDVCLPLAGESQIATLFDGLTWSATATPASSVLTGSDETQVVVPSVGLSEGYAHDLALMRFDDTADSLTIDLLAGGAFGSPDLPALYFIDTFTPYLRLSGWQADAERSAVHDLGDLDGDGHRELAVQGVIEDEQGLWLFDGETLQTAADLGLAGGTTSTLDADDADLVVMAGSDTLWPLTPATDVDGDGEVDLILQQTHASTVLSTVHLWLSAMEASP